MSVTVTVTAQLPVNTTSQHSQVVSHGTRCGNGTTQRSATHNHAGAPSQAPTTHRGKVELHTRQEFAKECVVLGLCPGRVLEQLDGISRFLLGLDGGQGQSSRRGLEQLAALLVGFDAIPHGLVDA